MREIMTRKAQAEAEERFTLEREAEKLLGLVAAEFRSDPMSVQCFDSRIVERVIAVSKRLDQLPRLFG